MNLILIKSNNSILELYDFLTKKIEDTKINIKDNNKTLEISINDEKLITTISLALAVKIISDEYIKLIDSAKSSLLEKDYDEKLFLNIVESDDIILSYISTIQILINEYFKDNRVLLIDSFCKFNCRGLKRELYELIHDRLLVYNSEVIRNNNANSLEKELKQSVSLNKQMGIEEINLSLNKFSKEVEYKNSTSFFNKFAKIHIKLIDNNIDFINKDDESVKADIINNTPGDILQIIKESDKSVKNSLLSLVLISVLKTKILIIHKSTPEEISSKLLRYLYDSQDYNNKISKVEIYRCKCCSS